MCDDPACPEITADIISGEIAYLHAFDAGMDELEVSRIVIGADDDSHMTYRSATAAACEENKVSAAEILPVNLLALKELSLRRRADVIAELFVNIA